MADSFAPNYSLASTDNAFSAIWKMTRCMKAAGWETVAHSDGVTKTSSGTNNNDSWGSNANPLDDTYPSFNTAQAWIVMRGPKTLKLNLSGAPSGTFLRGEQVVQATTGATGEVLGVVWDASTVSGWAVVLPRTGSFNGTNSVTGQLSGASFTPSSLKTYVREVVFFKGTNIYQGTAYYICAEETDESAQLFSTLAAAAGTTATVAPGAGGTGNAFPALGLCVRGTGGSVSHTSWFAALSTGWGATAMIAAVNATPSAGVSADGSFHVFITRGTPTGSFSGFMFSRLDDTEPGDPEPFIWWWNSGNAVSGFSRTTSTSYSNSQEDSWSNVMQQIYSQFKGYVARGCPIGARDVLTYYFGAYRGTTQSSYTPAANIGQPNPHFVQNHPNASPPYVRDFVSVVTPGTVRQHKGTVRWMAVTSYGQYKDTIDGKKLMCIQPYVTNTNPGLFIGPLDGSTTPT
jgi:hypothetical protein